MVSLFKGRDERSASWRIVLDNSLPVILLFQVCRAVAQQIQLRLEVNKMKLLPKWLKAKIPPLCSQDNVFDPMVICKYFDPTGSYTWYVMEGKEREDGDFEFYGYVIGNFREFGYFTLRELETAKKRCKGLKALPIERDLYFTPCKLSEIKKLHGSDR